MRGYFDGDGHIADYRIDISSTWENDWKNFISLCLEIGISNINIRKYKHPTKPHQFSSVRFTQDNSKKFLDYIYNTYKDDKIGLERKYKLYVAQFLNR